MDTVFRSWVTNPNELLIVPFDVADTPRRRIEAAEQSGIPVSDWRESPAVGIPLPTYHNVEWQQQGLRRWAGLNPGFLWHPLAWLPPRLAYPLSLVDEDGNITIESPDAHAIRIALEMSLSGLYDHVTGGWADVCSIVGIDLENHEDLQRCADWLQGAPDPILDDIDLDNFLVTNPDEPDWSAIQSQTLAGIVVPASMGVGAQSLVDHIHQIDQANDVSDRTRLRELSTACIAARNRLDDAAGWDAIIGRIQQCQSWDEARVAVLGNIGTELRRVSHVYSPAFDDLNDVLAMAAQYSTPAGGAMAQ